MGPYPGLDQGIAFGKVVGEILPESKPLNGRLPEMLSAGELAAAEIEKLFPASRPVSDGREVF